MNATHTPFAFHAYPGQSAKHRVTLPSPSILRRGATKIALILGGVTAMGYLMALSFFRLG